MSDLYGAGTTITSALVDAEMGRSGGADLAEIRCVDDVHAGCDHDPDRVAYAPNPSGGES